MDITEARNQIGLVKYFNKDTLDLSSATEATKLNSKDLLNLIPEIEELKSLNKLNLSWNKITNANCLSQLTSLTDLNLNGNRIKNYDFLIELTNLNNLDLSWDKLKNKEFLNKLNYLVSLDLSNRRLSNYEFLNEIKNLVSLNLSRNKLSDISFLKNLKNLSKLDLSRNKLKDVSTLSYLKKLKWLDLRKNEISNVSFLAELKLLRTFHLNMWDSDLPKNILRIVDIDGNINQDQINQISRYYKQIEEQGKDYIYEAKVLVVGEPKAGKTTLTQKIKDNKKWQIEKKGKESKSTVGIVIDTLPFEYHNNKKKNITTHFWDFGGQDIQYVLHQYFFTESSLYILLADGRKELTNFNYWFEIIATLGKNSPVLVVLNENECKPIKTFNINEFRKEFGGTLESIEEKSVDFYLDSDGRFETLKNLIRQKVSNLSHIGQPLPKKWVEIRKKIEEIKDKKAYIEKDEFIAICKLYKLNNKQDQQQVLDYLHVLGVALNYKYDVNLRNKLILKPNWVIDALYVVLKDNKIEKDKGVFNVDYVDSLWEIEGYNSKDCEILLNLMQKGSFEIAYKLVNTNEFIVPILLPYKPTDYKIEEVNPIQMKMQYKFMPKGIISRLIVRLHKSIVIKDEQIVWNKGVLLGHKDSLAEVIEREQAREIFIKVVGDNPNHNKELLTIVRNEIVDIHKDWFSNRLEFQELVPCICEICRESDEKQLFRLSVLENALNKNKDNIECQTSFQTVNVRELLEGIYIEDKKRQGNQFMNNENTFHIAGNAQITTNPRDNVSITQINDSIDRIENAINSQYKKIEDGLNLITLNQCFSKEKQQEYINSITSEMQIMLNEIMSVIGFAFEKLDGNEQRRYESLKHKEDWESTLTFIVPIIDKFGIKIETKTKLENIKQKLKNLLKPNHNSEKLNP